MYSDNSNIITVNCKNVYVEVWLGGIVLRQFKLSSIDGVISISTRFTRIGTKRFINMQITTIDNGVETEFLSPIESDLTGRMDVHIYDLDDDLCEVGFIEDEDCRELFVENDPIYTLFENEKNYLNSIVRIEIIHNMHSPDNINILYSDNDMSFAAVSDIFNYYSGLLNILKLRIFKDIMSYYNVVDTKDRRAPLTPKEISDVFHHFTDNVIFTIYD